MIKQILLTNIFCFSQIIEILNIKRKSNIKIRIFFKKLEKFNKFSYYLNVYYYQNKL